MSSFGRANALSARRLRSGRTLVHAPAVRRVAASQLFHKKLDLRGVCARDANIAAERTARYQHCAVRRALAAVARRDRPLEFGTKGGILLLTQRPFVRIVTSTHILRGSQSHSPDGKTQNDNYSQASPDHRDRLRCDRTNFAAGSKSISTASSSSKHPPQLNHQVVATSNSSELFGGRRPSVLFAK